MQWKSASFYTWQIDCNAYQANGPEVRMCKKLKISPGGESNARSQDFVVINYSLAP